MGRAPQIWLAVAVILGSALIFLFLLSIGALGSPTDRKGRTYYEATVSYRAYYPLLFGKICVRNIRISEFREQGFLTNPAALRTPPPLGIIKAKVRVESIPVCERIRRGSAVDTFTLLRGQKKDREVTINRLPEGASCYLKVEVYADGKKQCERKAKFEVPR